MYQDSPKGTIKKGSDKPNSWNRKGRDMEELPLDSTGEGKLQKSGEEIRKIEMEEKSLPVHLKVKGSEELSTITLFEKEEPASALDCDCSQRADFWCGTGKSRQPPCFPDTQLNGEKGKNSGPRKAVKKRNLGREGVTSHPGGGLRQ